MNLLRASQPRDAFAHTPGAAAASPSRPGPERAHAAVTPDVAHAPWVIVLAGGEGRRLRRPAGRWRGLDRPKQFCALVGLRSVLQHTLDRAALVTRPERIVTVIGPGQRAHLERSTHAESAGRVLEQPRDRGTTAGVFMALAHVLLQDPDANVVVMPAAQFVAPDEAFARHARAASAAAADHPGRIVMLGAVPRGSDGDLGWIVPGEALEEPLDPGRREGLHGVAWFRERPPRAGAVRLLHNGALWSTQVFAARGETLWMLGERVVPGLMESFAAVALAMQGVLARRITPALQAEITRSAYDELAYTDLTPALLQGATGQMAVRRMDDVLWADWSRPERVVEMLDLLERGPSAFVAPDRFAAAGRSLGVHVAAG